jgi:hypothetical protein
MKRIKTIKKTLGIAAAVMMGVSAQAVQYVDTDIIGKVLSSSAPSAGGEFNIATADGDGLDIVGYQPSSESIIFAMAQFTILDWDGNFEAVEVELGSANFIAASGTFGTGFTTLSGVVSGAAYFDLNEDGIIAYTIEWVGGHAFTAIAASLNAYTAPKTPTNVPDGGLTLSLLGMGLVGLGWLSKKSKQ